MAADVTVAWSVVTGTAETADLGTTTSGTVTFPANSGANATRTITVAVNDDNLSEGSEAFSVTLGDDTGDQADDVWVKSTAASVTATIAESDPITVSISGTSSSVEEGDAVTYTVSISGGVPSADLTVDYATADGTAKAGSDYTAESGTLTFTNADTGDKTFTVQTTEDMRAEFSETFTVTISNPSGGGGPAPSLGTVTSVTTTIDDDDPTSDPPDNRPGAMGDVDVWLSVSPATVNEDAGETNFTVTANHNSGTPPNTPTTISLTLAGTANESDYTAPTQASVTIPAGQSSGEGTLTLTLINDELIEGDETIIIGGSSGSLDIDSTLITIHDDDSTYLSISGPSGNVAEGGNASFTVTLSQTVAADVTVAWSAILDTDTAVAADLSASSGSVTFPANSAANATQTFTVAVTDDDLSEGSETFSVTLGDDTGDQADTVWVKSTAVSATATIAESDPITVSISGPSSVDEGDATTNYTVSLSGGTPTQDLTVTYATSDGTAKAGTDYTDQTAILTFTATAAGSQTFTVSTSDDNVDEGTGETFAVSISNPLGGGGATPTIGTSSVTTTITDDDEPSDVDLSVSPSSVKENDGATEITVTATLKGATRSEATVVTIGALSGSATKDTDYTATTLATITIAANATSGTGTLTITPTNDEMVEGDETIILSGTTTTEVGLDVSDATITLTDHSTSEQRDSAKLSISGPTSNVAEGEDATFTVTLSKAVAAQVQVAWSAPLSTDTAVAADLATTSSIVTFAANSAAGATQTITIATTDDALSEGDETFTVTLGTITSTLSAQVSVDTSAGSATATIAESDPITVNISGPSSVNEGDAATYTVSLSPAGVTPTEPLAVTVSYTTSGDTATAGTDYTPASSTVTFTSAGPQTIRVQTTQDIVDESDETFTVTISSPLGGGGPAPSLGTTSVTTTIADDDTGESPNPPRLPEPPVLVQPTPTPTPTPTVTPTPGPTATPSPTPEATPSPTPEATPVPTPEATPAPTPEATPTPTPEATPVPTPSPRPRATPTPGATPRPTPEAFPTPTPTPVPGTAQESPRGITAVNGAVSAHGTASTPVPGMALALTLDTVPTPSMETTNGSHQPAVRSTGGSDSTLTDAPAPRIIPWSWLSPVPWWLLLLLAALIAIAIMVTRKLLRRLLHQGTIAS